MASPSSALLNLLLMFVSARALCLAVLGRRGAALRNDRPMRDASRRGTRMASGAEVIDIEARSLS